ncbi:MAG TPA: ACP S-malonyltransferase [Smithellaceae bacterium]|nr:ACP S-malonyltransferase [Smithellaceae bacterium]
MTRIALVFPGQGTQHTGMGKTLLAGYDTARKVFDRASSVLGVDIRKLCLESPQEVLDLTVNTQIAVLTLSMALHDVFKKETNISPYVIAGHSLGEYCALYAAGAIDFADVLLLVQARARYHQEACSPGEGAMAAIIGMDDGSVAEICREISTGQSRVSVAIENAPQQIVVSGHAAAVEKVMVEARKKGAVKVVELPISVPCHCGLLQSAADRFAETLAGVTFKDFAIPVIPNCNPEMFYSRENAKQFLVNQIISPVQWRQTVDKMSAMDVQTIVEIGPKKTLCGLIKRINKNIQLFCIEDAVSLQKTAALLCP